MDDTESYNDQWIRRFREARAAGRELDRPLLLAHHRGRKTGTERITPLSYLDLGGSWVVFASKHGAQVNPDWYLNLVAHPRTTIEIGAETVEVTARTAEGEERARIWEVQTKAAPRFADYESKAAPRQIPVVIFEPVG